MNCPECGTQITTIITTGPSEHEARPCGCRASLSVRQRFMHPLVTDGGTDHSVGDKDQFEEQFTFVLECPDCENWVATTSTVAGPFEAPPKCYCPEHDDWVEMIPEPVDNPQRPEEQGVKRP